MSDSQRRSRLAPEDKDAALLVRADTGNGVLTLRLLGEVDLHTATGLRDQLRDMLRAWPYSAVIDVSGLTFCGLAGLDVLHEALARVCPAGEQIRVTGMSAQLSWLDQAFPAQRGPCIAAVDEDGSAA
jgi:anti-anti-sigma factor